MQSVIVSTVPGPDTTTGPTALVGESDGARVSVTSVTAAGTHLEATIEYSRDLRPFFDEQPFYVDYDVDVSDVPDSILTIPVLAQVCPVAWARGADVHVPVIDRRFLDSLQTVGGVLADMYPFIDGGRIVVDHAPETNLGDFDSTGMLFTGGVDSLATYVRHREADPTLITIKGWTLDVDDDERWAHTKQSIEAYADRFDVDAQFVRSNMLEFLDTTMLNANYKPHHDGSWYSAVGSGLGMTGLCAPLAVATGLSRLYVAASHWEGFPVPDEYDYWDGPSIPWGSDPAIDNEVAWSGTDVRHDGFELTRQERIDVIAAYVRDHDESVPVRACESSETGHNCNRCEKCVRTAFGLAFAGLDPNDHGFDVDARTFERAREKFEAGEWLLDHHHQVYWQAFRRLVGREMESTFPVDGAAEFADWLRDADVEAFAARSDAPLGHRLLRAAARNVPYPLYRHLYPVYVTLRRYMDPSRLLVSVT